MRSKKLHITLVVLCSLIFVSLGSGILAQSNETILTVIMPEWLISNAPEDAFSEFEAQHPGVKVVMVNPKDALYFASPQYDIDEYLNSVEKLVNMADVIYPGMGTNYIITPFATRAGYFLDLSPLTNGDTSLNADDFYEGAWRSYQWDRGVWALPVSASPSFLIYREDSFDNAGLSYPDTEWTIDDFAHAQRQLRQEDANGKITDPGFYSFGDENLILLRAFYGRNFMATATDALEPDFTSPELESLLTTWIEYQEDELLGAWSPEGNFTFDLGNAALSINQSFMLSMRSNAENVTKGTLLPGNIASLMVSPVAVSAGTQYPELAYELAKFMTTNPEIMNVIRDGQPARRSAQSQEETSSWAVPESPETRALVELATENGLGVSDMLFSDYIGGILNEASTDEFPGLSIALEEAEQKVLNDLQIAEARRNQTFLAVATPVPTPSLSEGQIAINFGINNMSSQLVNEELWNQVLEDFLASNPRIGRVTITPDFVYTTEEMAAKYDCFYLPFNAVQSDTSNILSLDPFFDTDMNFDRNDFLGSILQQVQRENRTWAYPIDIRPEMLWYHAELFTQAGIPLPENGWTIDQFVDALSMLKLSASDSETTPFSPRSYGSSTHLLMLAAAFGSIPLDYRTNPVTINLTDPANVEGLQQVLDLVKAGYIQYDSLSVMRQASGGSVAIWMSSSSDETAIYNETISPYTFQNFNMIPDYQPPHRMVNYPTGTLYTPVTYDLGVAYISASTENADACYSWISTIAQHPALFNSIPAQWSNMDDPALLASTGADLSNFAQQLSTILNDPNTIEFPSQNAGDSSITAVLNRAITEIWLNDALDNYVLEEGVDLAQELTDAQQHIDEYLACAANIPTSTMSSLSITPDNEAEVMEQYKAYATCAIQTDDSLYTIFEAILNG